MKTILLTSMCVCLAFAAAAETVDVPAGETVTRTEALTENLVKTGDGVYVISGSSSAFKGTIDIQGGILEMANVAAVGTPSQITVSDGAQFRVSAAANNIFKGLKLFLSGTGPDGSGAFAWTDTQNVMTPFQNGRIVLSADTKISVAASVNEWLKNGTLDFGGHTLTLSADKGVTFYMMKYENPGNIILGGKLSLAYNAPGGTSENFIRFAETTSDSEKMCTLTFFKVSGDFPWSIDSDVDSRIFVSLILDPDVNEIVISGNVDVAPSTTLTLRGGDTSYRTTFGGVVTGGGEGTKISVINGTWYVNNPENDFAADLAVDTSARILFGCKGAFPRYGGIRIPFNAGGRQNYVAFVAGEGGWTIPEMSEVLESDRIATGSNLDVPGVWTRKGTSLTNSSDIAEGEIVRHVGEGEYVLAGDVSDGAVVRNEGAGAVVATSNDRDTKRNPPTRLYSSDGDIVLRDFGNVEHQYSGDGSYPLHSQYKHGIGRLAVEGGTSWVGVDDGSESVPFIRPYVYSRSGNDDWGGRSIFEIRDGAYVNEVVRSDNINVYSIGAFYVRGGQYVLPNVNGTMYYGMNGGLFFFEISGGVATYHKPIFMMRDARGNLSDTLNLGCVDAIASTFAVHGGECRFLSGSKLTVGLDGNAFYYQDGGVCSIEVDGGTTSYGMYVNSPIWWQSNVASSWTGGVAAVAIEGGRLSIASSMFLGGRSDGTAYLNVNGGGTLSVRQIRKDVGSRTGQRSYVGFDGGVLEANGSCDILPSGGNAVDSVVLYKGGLTVDTAGHDVTISVPLEGASGLGVTDVALPEGMPTTGYQGAHMVRIKGGSGEGAIAILDVNTTNNTLRGVKVVSPGYGYAEGDTLTALAKDGAMMNGSRQWIFTEYACTVTLGDVSGGGLVKRGAGSLTLMAPATYTGDTVLEAGTLVLGVANALTSRQMVCKGGTLDAADGVDYPQGLAFDASGLSTQRRRHVIARRWNGGIGCVSDMPEGYVAKMFLGNLVVSRDSGFCVTVR